MVCPMCGREIMNPEANYCDYCGTRLHGMEYKETVEPQAFPETKEKQPRVSTGLFLGVMLLPMIPMIGWILYLVFLFYWAFASSIEDSRKSFARASLIYSGITLVLVIVFVSVICSTLASELAGVL